MAPAQKLDLIYEDEYLAQEARASVRHEYLSGVVYAMAGSSSLHNRIVSRLITALNQRLSTRSCEAYPPDMKLRIENGDEVRLYYPDTMIVCEHAEGSAAFLDKPVIVFEVLSKSTRRIDESEKKQAYLTSLPYIVTS